MPPAYPHGAIEELFDDVFFITGSVVMAGPVPLRCSRNMTIVRQGKSLVLINSMRLSEDGLEALSKLGKVEHVIRLAGFHGMDDPFYKERFGARIWVVENQVYAAKFDAPKTAADDGYFEPDEKMTDDTGLPIDGARLIRLDCNVGEGILQLDREGGILISGDSLQNWQKTDYFNWIGKVLMRMLGFIKPHNVGPGWLKYAKPDIGQIKALLDVEFEHLLPAHGQAVIGGARDKFRPAIERLR